MKLINIKSMTLDEAYEFYLSTGFSFKVNDGKLKGFMK